MPDISRQIAKQVRRPVVPVSRNGPSSVLSEAVPVAEVEHDFVKMVLYGQNRIGKTWLACQFPKPLLLISFEPGQGGGSRTVRKVEGVKYLRITSTAKLHQLTEELASDTVYKTHVLDSCTSLQDVVLAEMMAERGSTKPEQLDFGLVSSDEYRDRSSKAKELMKPFRDLAAHTIYIALERDHNRPKDERTGFLAGGLRVESHFAADLGEATVKWLHNACDFICRLYMDREVITRKTVNKVQGKEVITEQQIDTGRLVRRLRCLYHTNFAGGFRSEHPRAVPEYIQNPSWVKIEKVIRGLSVGTE